HKILIIPMHMSKDTPILKRLEDKCRNENLYSYYEDMSVTTLMGIFSKAQMVLAMRLHGVIYSAAVHTKPLAISYDPKVTSFMESIDSDYIIDINDIDGQKVYQEIKRCLDDEDYLNNIKNKDEERKELARLNAVEALDLLKDMNEKN
ncbi:MAG: polysaccharide pyruvyl transferase family protein, partial [Ezakiella massiliensis]